MTSLPARAAASSPSAPAGAPTPGPWAIGGRFGRNRTEVTNAGGGRAIATVWTHEGGDRDPRTDQTRDYTEVSEGMANLRLVAAAPDLLAALENAVQFISLQCAADGRTEKLIELRAIIAKAKGGAS